MSARKTRRRLRSRLENCIVFTIDLKSHHFIHIRFFDTRATACRPADHAHRTNTKDNVVKKTIAVVGAGPGIGMAVAQRFGREGFNVALIARNSDKLQRLVSKLEETSVEAAAFQADVLDRPCLVVALEKVAAHFGSVDVLEYGPTPPFDSMRGPRELDVENEQYHLDLQVLGAISAVRTVLPGMLDIKAGSLLFTTAASAHNIRPQ
jgi:NADP-dependent 3-hydroxy acid dehydrogenase YdfG